MRDFEKIATSKDRTEVSRLSQSLRKPHKSIVWYYFFKIKRHNRITADHSLDSLVYQSGSGRMSWKPKYQRSEMYFNKKTALKLNCTIPLRGKDPVPGDRLVFTYSDCYSEPCQSTNGCCTRLKSKYNLKGKMALTEAL